MEKIILLGGRGHASDVLGALEAIDTSLAATPGLHFLVLGFLADGAVDHRRFEGRSLPHLGSVDRIGEVGATHFISCAGYPVGRKTLETRARLVGLRPFTVIHPRAWIPDNVTVGDGAVIMAGVCISPMAKIGNHAYLAHGCLIEHDTQVGDFVTVMPGASVSGDVVLGEGCTIGANATVLEKCSVGPWATVGAGSVVTKDVPPNVTAKGIPARW